MRATCGGDGLNSRPMTMVTFSERWLMCENTSESSYIDVIEGEVKIGACADSRGGDGDNGRRSNAMQCNAMQCNVIQWKSEWKEERTD